MAEFARRVHNRLAAAADLQQAYIDAHEALMAVVDKCEQMRAESATASSGGVGRFLADEFESVIAEALGIKGN